MPPAPAAPPPAAFRPAAAAAAASGQKQGQVSGPNDSAEGYPEGREEDLEEEEKKEKEGDWEGDEGEGDLPLDEVGDLDFYYNKDGLGHTRSKRDTSSARSEAATPHKRQNLPEEISDLTLEEEIKEWGRWEEREGKRQRNSRGKRRRHRLRHGKRRHERGNRELLDTDFSFGSFGFVGSSSIDFDDNQDKRNSHGSHVTSQPVMRAYNYQQDQGQLPDVEDEEDWADHRSVKATMASHKKNVKSTPSGFRSSDYVTVPSGKSICSSLPAVNQFRVSQRPSKRPRAFETLGIRSKVHSPSALGERDILQPAAKFKSSSMNDEIRFQKDDPVERASDRRTSIHQVRKHKGSAETQHPEQPGLDESMKGAKGLLSFSSAVLNPLSVNTGDSRSMKLDDLDLTKSRKHKIGFEEETRQSPTITASSALQNSELFIDREQFKISVSKNYSTQRQNNYVTAEPDISTELNYKYEHKKEDEREKKNETRDIVSDVRYFEKSNSQPSVEGRGPAISIHISSPPIHRSLGTTPTELLPAEDALGKDKHHILPFSSPSDSHYTPASPTFPTPPPTPSSLPLPAPSISPSSASSVSLGAKEDSQLKYPSRVISDSGRVERVTEKDLPAEVLLQSPSIREVSSAPLVVLNHETLRKSQTPSSEMAAAAAALAAASSSSSCYSTNDIIVVIFLTSLVNMVVFLVVTLGLCWCSLRGRLNAAPPRAMRADDQRSEDNDEEAEMAVSSEGCLEACLPDISYQRHIARGTTLRPTFVMGRALRPLVSPNPPRLSHAVHELLHTLTNSSDYQQHKKKLTLANRRSLSLENLALT
ncbi:LOW QUALITY PROTEIN: uncharacterized protein [Palaemon carinicauda]|uniref:LOW QUALITY PROTEIN: uncharacterized protein n=1 Tax=Palaemon carinicauda TaxID=392227 RepID=UPI0035B574B2